METLFTWLGTADLKAFKAGAPDEGPVSKMLLAHKFSTVVVIGDWRTKNTDHGVNYSKENIRSYINWLNKLSAADVKLELTQIQNPIDIAAIFSASLEVVKKHSSALAFSTELSFNLSSGTWAMAYVWSMIAKNSKHNKNTANNATKMQNKNAKSCSSINLNSS